jgi:hypothetical protein
MPKKVKEAVGVTFGAIKSFPTCCSAKTWASLGVTEVTPYTRNQGKGMPSYVPPALLSLREGQWKRLNKMTASLRIWPERIYHSFLLQYWIDHAVKGGAGWQCRMIVIADNIEGHRKHKRGSGFAEFCATVPGVTVARSGGYPGAHVHECQGYFLIMDDISKVERYIKRSLDMVNSRLKKLRTDPVRIKKGLNLKRASDSPTRYW